MKIRKNIYLEEIECKCGCGLNKMSPATLDIVQSARDYFGKPVIIHSGCRCESHNKKVGGLPNSKHLPDEFAGVSRAIDFHVEGVSIKDLHEYLVNKCPNSNGIGYYDEFCHVDDRMDRPHRWDLRKRKDK